MTHRTDRWSYVTVYRLQRSWQLRWRPISGNAEAALLREHA